jgi:hypothetical protein
MVSITCMVWPPPNKKALSAVLEEDFPSAFFISAVSVIFDPSDYLVPRFSSAHRPDGSMAEFILTRLIV